MEKQVKKRSDSNYLEYIPSPNPRYPWEMDEDGNVVILMEHTGLFHKMTQLLLRKPKVSHIHLDDMGSYIWKQMDGKNRVYDIAMLVKEEYGENAEPLYNRLVQHMRNLENNGFITMKN